jgi:hypothetical protein
VRNTLLPRDVPVEGEDIILDDRVIGPLSRKDRIDLLEVT